MEVRYDPTRIKPFKFNRVWNTRDELKAMGLDWVCHNVVLMFYGGRKNVVDLINRDLNRLANNYAEYNAHGIPVTGEGSLTLEHGVTFKFKEEVILTSEHLPKVLKELADILAKYY